MGTDAIYEPDEGEIFLAGERVPPGAYREIAGPRMVVLDHEDYLPASLDGRVACYERMRYTWGQIQKGCGPRVNRSPSRSRTPAPFLVRK